MKTIRFTGVLIIGALILASCSSSTPSASSTSTTSPGSGSSTSSTTTTAVVTNSTGSAALSTVWPTCCAANLTAIGKAAEAVGNDVTQIGKNGGSGSTAQLVKDLGTLSTAVSSGLQATSTALSQVSNAGLTSYNNALSGLRTATNNAKSGCSSTTNACLNDIQSIEGKLTSVTDTASQLNTQVTGS
ncbi:MAG TPA: hypothetical protein VG014_07820 [Acidimicrobiales bacterium]|nr:hypothetical protein [Acidimicrobiales bacterium]